MNIEEIKKDCRMFKNKNITYLDSGATTQKPIQVINAIKEMLNIENIVSIQSEKADKRDEMIVEIVSKMKIEKRQLARILGVNDRTIFRAIHKQK